MLEINARLIKIIRIKEMHAGNNKNYANVKNLVENQNNYKKKNTNPYENYEIQKNSRDPCEN